MKWIFIIVIVIGFYGNQVAKKNQIEQVYNSADTSKKLSITENKPSENNSQYKCDGRTHCSNMTSCAEATYFLQNCPGVEMDGNQDGVPCERQWCN
jgi:hypothetical protein